MLVLTQKTGMRVRLDLGDGRVGFVFSRFENGKVRLFLDLPEEVRISRVEADEPADLQGSRPGAIEAMVRGYSAALAGTIWEGGVR